MGDDKITQPELAELFGPEMPIIAVKLLWTPDKLTVDDLRQILTALALPAAAPAEDVRAGMDVLSSLSSYLGAGLGDDATTAAQYDKRIRWGIDDQISATVHRCAAVIEELSKDAYSGQPVQWGQIRQAILALIPEAKS